MPVGEFPREKIARKLEYFTPQTILEPVRDYFRRSNDTTGTGIELDPATIASNPTEAETWLTEEDDGLSTAWDFPTFVNPPYGKHLKDWCQKIHHEAKTNETEIIALLPGQRFEQRYYQDHVFCDELDAVCMIRKRVNFLDEDGQRIQGNPYGSFLFLYNGKVRLFARVMSTLGLVMEPRVLSRAGF